MLASPPPSTDVKSDHRFQSAALVQHHQHLSTSLAHRAPYDLYHHSAHEPEVYNSEFNWDSSNSNLRLPTFNIPPRYHHAGMEKKTNSNSPQTSGPAFTTPLPAITNSVSPPPLSVVVADGRFVILINVCTDSELPFMIWTWILVTYHRVNGKCQSDGRTTHENSLAGRHAMQTERDAGESRPLSTKRPRPPSLSQLDVRCFERYPYSVLVASGHTSPSGYSPYGSGAVTKEEDAHSLPPIVTREEREQDVCSGDIKPIVQVPAVNYPERQQPHSAADSDEMLENSSSSQKPTDTNSNQSPQLDRQFSHSPRVITNQPSVQLSTSSETATLAPEPYPPSQQNRTHPAPATPHSATSVSFSSHQQLPQPTSFPNHSNGYFSALPSPVAPHANGQHVLPQNASYPGSPTMTMTAPSSATFAPDTTSSFGPISPQMSSAAAQHHHLAPSASPLYRSSATAFPHTAAAHLIGSSYPTSGAAQGVAGPSPSSTRAAAVSASVSSAVPATSTSQWGTTENQAPRRRGKLPQGVTNILRTWLMAHTGHPYPTEEEKKTLCEQTQLSINQVSNWFINARRRILVPPTGGSSVHEIRQPVRRQAQSQLVRAAANAGVTPPGLPLHHLTPQPIGGSLASPTMFSPASGALSNISGGGAFEFRYPLPHHTQSHESTFHNSGLPACRLPNSLTSTHGQWTNSAHHTVRPTLNSSSYSGVNGPNSGSVPYYPPSHSPYSHYSAGHSTFTTPLPSPHYPPPYSGCPSHYPTQPRLHSPCSHPDSHPSTPTIPHSHSHQTTATCVSQPPCTQSANYPSTPDRELK